MQKCLLAALELKLSLLCVDEKYEAMYGGRADLKAAIDPIRELHPTVYHTDDESNATHSTCHQRQRCGYPSPSAGHDTEEPQIEFFLKKQKNQKEFFVFYFSKKDGDRRQDRVCLSRKGMLEPPNRGPAAASPDC